MIPRITDSGRPLSLDDLQNAEHRLNVQLPNDYRSFLLAHNGGKPTPAWFRHGKDPSDVAMITRFFSLEEMEAETRDLRTDFRSDDLIAMGTSSDTDRLVLSTASAQLGAVFWNSSDEDAAPDDFIRVAASIEQLLTNLDYPESTKPWMMLVDNDDVEGLRQWLDNGGDVQARDEVVTGLTVLEHAASTGRLEIVKLLVSRGAKPRGGLRRPSAHRYAVQAGHREVADFLAKHGMAKGYWLQYLIGAVCVLAAIGLAFVPQPRELLQNKVVLILLISVVAVAVGIALMYDWLKRSETGGADGNEEQGRNSR
jgi:cell wall assembly regulator SMI1